MSGRTIALIQARMSSTRLPGKVLGDVLGQPMLARQIERVRRARLVGLVAVATSDERSDDAIATLCEDEGVPCYRGSLTDVLGRMQSAAVRFAPADHVVRLTGDCPLSDPDLIDACIAIHRANGADYTSNAHSRTYPDGLDVEVMTAAALARAAREARDPYEREHVTPYLYRHPEVFRLETLAFSRDLSALRWTVDRAEDFALVVAVFEQLYPRNPNFSWRDVLTFVEELPDLTALNMPG